jgi:hypothetical protein
MGIELACSAYVEHDTSTPACAWLTLKPDVEGYLEAHVEDLMKKADTNASPPANFNSRRGEQAFESLATGTDNAFFAAAQDLATSLYDAMDGRTRRGLLIALRRDVAPRVAVLKLDVVRDSAAVLGAGGEIDPVHDLLDITGQLQKGAVTPDARPNSAVIVGDKLGDAAKYFLDALDISQLQNPTKAVADVARVIYEKAPDVAEAAIDRLPSSQAGTVAEFMSSVSDLIDSDRRDAVLSALDQQFRPARFLDTRHATVTKTIRGDGITIKGSLADMEKVRLEQVRGTDKYRLEIEFDRKPEIRF